MKDALKKLDKLTQEEARMAVAQNLKVTHAVDDRVRGVDNRVADVNDRVAGVDDRVARHAAHVDDQIAGIDERIASVARATHVIEDWVRSQEHELVVDDRVANIDHPVAEAINGAETIFSQAQQMFNLSHTDGNAANQVTKQTANDVLDEVKRSSSPAFISAAHGLLHTISENQLRKDIDKWLSPPDPSTNHKIACDTYNKKTATWFFQGSIFREWKSTASLLWIHGKRAFSLASYRIPSDRILNYSWLWQEYSLVS
jgi:hypothetical protein